MVTKHKSSTPSYIHLNLCKTPTVKKAEHCFFQNKLSLNAGQEYCGMLQYFRPIKLPFVIKVFVLSIFEWPFYTGFTVFQNQYKTKYNLCLLSKSSQNFIQDPLTEGMRIIQHTSKTKVENNTFCFHDLKNMPRKACIWLNTYGQRVCQDKLFTRIQPSMSDRLFIPWKYTYYSLYFIPFIVFPRKNRQTTSKKIIA